MADLETMGALFREERHLAEAMRTGDRSAVLRRSEVALRLGHYRRALELCRAVVEIGARGTAMVEARLGTAEALVGLRRLGEAAGELEPLARDDQIPDTFAIGQTFTPEGPLGFRHPAPFMQCPRPDAPWIQPRRRWFLESHPGTRSSPVFIGGAGRSGTTLLRAMLGAHPRLHAAREWKLLPALAELVDRFDGGVGPFGGDAIRGAAGAMFRHLQTVALAGDQAGLRLVEKTPHNVLHMRTLARITVGARFIHLVRDGRAVVESLLRQDWCDENGNPFPFTQNARTAAYYWKATVLQARYQSSQLLGRVLEVRYEDLVEEPRRTMERVLRFIGEPWDDAVLKHHTYALDLPATESSSEHAREPVHARAVHRWRDDLPERDRMVVEEVAGDLLDDLGYEVSGGAR